MGPDEYPTREELGVLVKYLLAELKFQARRTTTVVALLARKGITNELEFSELLDALGGSEARALVERRRQALRDFEASHNILRTLGLLPEDF